MNTPLPRSVDPAGPAELPVAGPGSPAAYGRRLIALIVDGVLCVLVAALIARPQQWSSLVLIVEYLFFTGLFGETPGMRLLRLRCVQLASVQEPSSRAASARAASAREGCPVGQPLGLGRALVRAVLLSLVVPALVTDADGRGLHDKAARSVMVNAR